MHNAAEGVFLNSRQWMLMDHLCSVLKPFEFTTREIISDDALLSQVLKSAKLQKLKLQGMRPSLEGQKVCLAAGLPTNMWSRLENCLERYKCVQGPVFCVLILSSSFFILK